MEPVEVKKYERQCERCRHWFWAWSPYRFLCYFCCP